MIAFLEWLFFPESYYWRKHVERCRERGVVAYTFDRNAGLRVDIKSVFASKKFNRQVKP